MTQTDRENREYISMPAAGLGVFGGNATTYFKALMEVAAEFPQLRIIYHPAQFTAEFTKELTTAILKNVVMATKDVFFIADELTRNGMPCAFHNPSDQAVVFGNYDVGMIWKTGTAEGYVGEEHIGAMTTAPLNSRKLNPNAYTNIVEVALESQISMRTDANNPPYIKTMFFSQPANSTSSTSSSTNMTHPKININKLLSETEKRVGIFSYYATAELGLSSESILFALKPAQQFLSGLGVSANSAAQLSSKIDETAITVTNTTDVIIKNFVPDNSLPDLLIKKERIDRLLNSAKTYVNTILVPAGLVSQLMQSRDNTSFKPIVINGESIHVENIAVGIAHVQEIDLLIRQEIIDDEAVVAKRSGTITNIAPAILLISSPALNFKGKANQLSLSNQIKFIQAMYRTILNAAIQEKREYIAMSATLLEVFGGDASSHFGALMDVAAEFPQLQIIYHPAEFTADFIKVLNAANLTNVHRATKDVLFIADELTRNGHPCALHNPSDIAVVFGTHDVGMFWKIAKGKANAYLEQEHIGAMTTAPLNSRKLNPNAYSHIVEMALTGQKDEQIISAVSTTAKVI